MNRLLRFPVLLLCFLTVLPRVAVSGNLLQLPQCLDPNIRPPSESAKHSPTSCADYNCKAIETTALETRACKPNEGDGAEIGKLEVLVNGKPGALAGAGDEVTFVATLDGAKGSFAPFDRHRVCATKSANPDIPPLGFFDSGVHEVAITVTLPPNSIALGKLDKDKNRQPFVTLVSPTGSGAHASAGFLNRAVDDTIVATWEPLGKAPLKDKNGNVNAWIDHAGPGLSLCDLEAGCKQICDVITGLCHNDIFSTVPGGDRFKVGDQFMLKVKIAEGTEPSKNWLTAKAKFRVNLGQHFYDESPARTSFAFCCANPYLMANGSIPYINQYQAGESENLPESYKKKGGNACGISSLTMRLRQIIRDVGVQIPAEAKDSSGLLSVAYVFSYKMNGNGAQLQKEADGAAKRGDLMSDDGFTHDKSVIQDLLKTLGLDKYYVAAKLSDITPDRLKDRVEEASHSDLQKVERLMCAGIPVLLGTGLCLGGCSPDGAHVILGLGATSDGSIVVQDPAGDHNASNYETPGSIGQGVTYAPDIVNGKDCIGTEVFTFNCLIVPLDLTKQGLAKRTLVVKGHSPVALRLISPSGKVAGAVPKPDGTFELVMEIPGAYYHAGDYPANFPLPPLPSDSDNRVKVTNPIGPQLVEVDDPEDGKWTLVSVGIGEGPVELDTFSLLDGEAKAQDTLRFNTIKNEVRTYSLLASVTPDASTAKLQQISVDMLDAGVGGGTGHGSGPASAGCSCRSAALETASIALALLLLRKRRRVS